MSEVRVLTVDDHAPFQRLAEEVIEATPGFESAGGAGSGLEGLEAIEREAPDLVLVDVHMPGIDGIEVTRRILRSGDDAVVVLISAEDVNELPAAARTCGAAEIVRKQDLGRARLRELWRAHRTARGTS